MPTAAISSTTAKCCAPTSNRSSRRSREVAGNDRDRPVLLRADARTPHQAVVTALDALGPARLLARVDRHRAAGAARRPRRSERPAASPWQTYRRLLGFARPYRGCSASRVLGMVLEAAAGGAFTQLMEPMVNETFVDPKTAVQPAGCRWRSSACSWCAASPAWSPTTTWRAPAAASRATCACSVLGKYLRLPGSRFDAEPVPSMLTRLGCDTEQVAQAAIDALKVMVSSQPARSSRCWG